MSNELTAKQYKAFLQLIKKDLARIEQLAGESYIKDEIKEVIGTIQAMTEDEE